MDMPRPMALTEKLVGLANFDAKAASHTMPQTVTNSSIRTTDVEDRH